MSEFLARAYHALCSDLKRGTISRKELNELSRLLGLSSKKSKRVPDDKMCAAILKKLRKHVNVPLPPVGEATKQTKFEGGYMYYRAQVAYLASRHKDHCTFGYAMGYETDIDAMIWYETDILNIPRIVITEISPSDLTLHNGTQLTLSRFNTLMEWVAEVFAEMQSQGKIQQSSLYSLVTVAENILEFVVSEPVPLRKLSKLQLIGMVSLIYELDVLTAYLTSFDAIIEYAYWVMKYQYPPKEIIETLDRFTKFIRHNDDQYIYVSYGVMAPYLSGINNSNITRCDKRFVMIPLILVPQEVVNGHVKSSDAVSHMNMLIYDKKSNTVERFEPTYPNPDYSDALDKELEKYFKQFGATYISPLAVCPIGIQRIQETESDKGKVTGKIEGFCQAWSFWYADLRLSNPDIPREVLVDKAMKLLKKQPSTLTEYIIDYTKFYDKFITSTK